MLNQPTLKLLFKKQPSFNFKTDTVSFCNHNLSKSELLCVQFSDTQGVWNLNKSVKILYISQKCLKSKQKVQISDTHWPKMHLKAEIFGNLTAMCVKSILVWISNTYSECLKSKHKVRFSNTFVKCLKFGPKVQFSDT